MITLTTIAGTSEAKLFSHCEGVLRDFEIIHKTTRGLTIPEETDGLFIGRHVRQELLHGLCENNDLKPVTLLIAAADAERYGALDSFPVVLLVTPFDVAEIISAIVSISFPGTYISRHRVAQHLSLHLLADTLTPREREVLHQISLGKPDDQIAETLTISIDTVHSHVKNLRKRLNARSRSHAVTLGHQLGILPLTTRTIAKTGEI